MNWEKVIYEQYSVFDDKYELRQSFKTSKFSKSISHNFLFFDLYQHTKLILNLLKQMDLKLKQNLHLFFHEQAQFKFHLKINNHLIIWDKYLKSKHLMANKNNPQIIYSLAIHFALVFNYFSDT